MSIIAKCMQLNEKLKIFYDITLTSFEFIKNFQLPF